MVAGGTSIAHLHMQEFVNYQSMSHAVADTGATAQAAGSSQGGRDGGRGGEIAGAGARYAVVYDASALMTALPLAPGECPGSYLTCPCEWWSSREVQAKALGSGKGKA